MLLSRFRRAVGLALTAAVVCLTLSTGPVSAGTTGTISGTVTNANGAPVAGAMVAVSSPSGSRTTTSDSKGFYVLQALSPDTYTLSVQLTGYEPQSIAGVVVQQDQTVAQNVKLTKNLTTIASVSARSISNLVQPNVTSNVYNVTGDQLNAASGGDNLHKTIYEYLATVPGVTSNGYPSQPRIHGGSVTDTNYEFDGIPIKDRITGFFTTNLSNVGIKNVEVITGGLSAGDAASGVGSINSVVKSGTYPSFGIASFGVTAPDYNNDMTLEYGGATANRKFSYYAAYDYVNSRNNYYFGGYTFPDILLSGFNGPGTVHTRDLVANFHLRPNDRNDIQFLMQNGIGEFNYNYLLNRAPGEALPLSMIPCPGATFDAANTYGTNALGGTSASGAPCGAGFQFGSLGNGQGNIWHHNSTLAKIQWNHIINDHSAFAFRVAENYNQYIFDQPLAEANVPSLENVPGGTSTGGAGCPSLPYAAGQPIPVVPASGTLCAGEPEVFYGDRSSNMYLVALDYTNTVNAGTQIKVGIGDEIDRNYLAYYNTFRLSAQSHTWPDLARLSDYPTHIPYVYASGSFRVNRFLLEPGLRYQRISYGIPLPIGAKSVSALTPTFAGTYAMGQNDTLRFSYTDSTSFVGTGYIFRSGSSNPPGGLYDPSKAGVSFQPTIIHSGDLMWEHQFDANTSMKVGPWFNNASNVYDFYRPVTQTVPKVKFGPSIPSNNGIRKAFGIELAVNHLDHRASGVSWWVSATLDNYWTNLTSSLYGSSYAQSTIPASLYQNGVLIRSTDNPMFNATFVADFHQDRLSVIPLVYYQVGTFYNVGSLSCYSSCPAGTFPQINKSENQAVGYWKVNVTALERLGPKGNLTVGIRGTNILNNLHDVAPCFSGGTGCFPFDGSQSGVTQTGLIYQNYQQDPPRLEFFLTTKF